jgi:hypothetical protein
MKGLVLIYSYIPSSDNSPVCPIPEYEVELSESVPVGTYVVTVEAHDPDLSKTICYEITTLRVKLLSPISPILHYCSEMRLSFCLRTARTDDTLRLYQYILLSSLPFVHAFSEMIQIRFLSHSNSVTAFRVKVEIASTPCSSLSFFAG